MSKVFVEYHILPQHRSAYSLWIKNVISFCPKLELLEGVDQPGLFVELWVGLSREIYDQMKAIRLDGSEPSLMGSDNSLYQEAIDWREMNNWVKGGAQKIHIWYFKKVR
jgi:hypothetical protein